MATFQFMTIENLNEYKSLQDAYVASLIEEASKSSFKAVSTSDDGFTLYFYKVATPTSIEQAAFSLTIPQPASKADKVSGATNGNFASLDANGNLKDSGKKATDFETAGAANAVEQKVLALLGQIPEGKTLMDIINNTVAEGIYDDTEVKTGIKSNKDRLDALVGSDTGTIRSIAANEVAKIVAGASESYDTLKDIENWISGHGSSAAEMNTAITNNNKAIEDLKKVIGSIPDTATATDVIGYISEAVGKALTDANLGQYATDAKVNTLTTRVKANEDAISALQQADTAIGTRIDAVEGSISSTKTELEGKIASVQGVASSAQSKADANGAAITALQSKVGDGFEAIPSESIKALFATQTP